MLTKRRGRPVSSIRRIPVGLTLTADLLRVVDEEVLRRRGLVLQGKIHASRASRTAVLTEALEAKFRLKLRAK